MRDLAEECYLQEEKHGIFAINLCDFWIPIPEKDAGVREKIVRAEVWCSRFTTAGEDFFVLRFFDANDNLILQYRRKGY